MRDGDTGAHERVGRDESGRAADGGGGGSGGSGGGGSGGGGSGGGGSGGCGRGASHSSVEDEGVGSGGQWRLVVEERLLSWLPPSAREAALRCLQPPSNVRLVRSSSLASIEATHATNLTWPHTLRVIVPASTARDRVE